ncbi:hypothetical protein L596_011173 [Steinernema carpocapsae]|uniref:Uncharacterized protein n=1 Tax=Steinernema carpocapsae TaxID=34508 RepID=A0A4U5NSW5_STECR|nr:hypothetical protein L596_011173 [Steinernema carpocapsae]
MDLNEQIGEEDFPSKPRQEKCFANRPNRNDQARRYFYSQIERGLMENLSVIPVVYVGDGATPMYPELPPGVRLKVIRKRAKKIGRPTRPEVPIVKEDGELPEFVHVERRDRADLQSCLEAKNSQYNFQRMKFKQPTGFVYKNGPLQGRSWDGDVDLAEGPNSDSNKKVIKEDLSINIKKEDKKVGRKKGKRTVLRPPAGQPIIVNGTEWIPPWPVNLAHVVAKPRGANGTELEVTAQVCEDTNLVNMVYTLKKEEPKPAEETPKVSRKRMQQPPTEVSKKSKMQKRKDQSDSQDLGQISPENPEGHFGFYDNNPSFSNSEVSMLSNNFEAVHENEEYHHLKSSIARWDYDENGKKKIAAQRRERFEEVAKHEGLSVYGKLLDEYRRDIAKFVMLVDPESSGYGGLMMKLALGNASEDEIDIMELEMQKKIFEVMGYAEEFHDKLSEVVVEKSDEDLYVVRPPQNGVPAFAMTDIGVEATEEEIEQAMEEGEDAELVEAREHDLEGDEHKRSEVLEMSTDSVTAAEEAATQFGEVTASLPVSLDLVKQELPEEEPQFEINSEKKFKIKEEDPDPDDVNASAEVSTSGNSGAELVALSQEEIRKPQKASEQKPELFSSASLGINSPAEFSWKKVEEVARRRGVEDGRVLIVAFPATTWTMAGDESSDEEQSLEDWPIQRPDPAPVAETASIEKEFKFKKKSEKSKLEYSCGSYGHTALSTFRESRSPAAPRKRPAS